MNSNGNHNLPVTERQYKQLMKGGQHDIELSKTHVQHLKKKGGIFPLLPAIPAIAAALGGAGALAGGVASAVNSTRTANELAHHNKAKEAKSGKGLYLRPQPKSGGVLPIIAKVLSDSAIRDKVFNDAANFL